VVMGAILYGDGLKVALSAASRRVRNLTEYYN